MRSLSCCVSHTGLRAHPWPAVNKRLCRVGGKQVCVDIYSDPNNCGACGRKLTRLNQVCDTGKPYNWPTNSPPCPKGRE